MEGCCDGVEGGGSMSQQPCDDQQAIN